MASPLLMHSSLLTRPAVTLVAVRTAAGRWRRQSGLPPRYASPSPLTDLPEFSFMDGRGPGPLTLGRRAKHLRDQQFAKEIINITGQMEVGKRLVPNQKRTELKIRAIDSSQMQFTWEQLV